MESKKHLSGFQESLKLRGLSKDTLKAYSDANRKFLLFIQKPPKYVTTKDIKKYLNLLIDKNQKPKTINLVISAMKCFYDDYMGRRLFTKIRRLKLEKSIPNVLSKNELRDMINSTENVKHKLIIQFLYSTGVRVGELVKVRVQDLDLKNGFIRIVNGKGKKDRLTIISKELCSSIKRYLKYGMNQVYLFQNKQGSHLSRRAVQEIINKAAKRVGIQRRVYPHALRASFASHLYDHGVQVQKIQKLMGHSDYRTTQCYIKSTTRDISNIKNPLDML